VGITLTGKFTYVKIAFFDDRPKIRYTAGKLHGTPSWMLMGEQV